MKDKFGSFAAQIKSLPHDQRTALVLLVGMTLALVTSYWSMLWMVADIVVAAAVLAWLSGAGLRARPAVDASRAVDADH